ADKRADGRAADDIGPDACFVQRLNDADVRPAACRTAAERKADPWTARTVHGLDGPLFFSHVLLLLVAGENKRSPSHVASKLARRACTRHKLLFGADFPFGNAAAD